MANSATYNRTKIHFAEGAAASTPDAAEVVTYAKADGLMYSKDDAGVETLMSGGAGGAPSTADYLVGTAQGGLSAEIVVGTSPNGELGGTWAAITVDATHSGSNHQNELDYVEFTAPVAPTATTEGTANTVVTGSSVAYNGSTVVMIEFFAPWARPAATTAADMVYWLYEDSASIGLIGSTRSAAAQNQWQPVSLSRRMTPSNASHTYSIRASVSTGTGSIQAGAGGITNTMPGYIRITRV